MAFFRHDCTKHGHRYEPRYDQEPAKCWWTEVPTILAIRQPELVQSMSTKQTYVRDVCTRCGAVVNRHQAVRWAGGGT